MFFVHRDVPVTSIVGEPVQSVVLNRSKVSLSATMADVRQTRRMPERIGDWGIGATRAEERGE